jgi:hypothetical protein
LVTSTLTSLGMYTHPFSNDGWLEPEALGNDACDLVTVCSWRNLSGIFVVFEGVEEVTCQRCGLRTIEVNPHHAVGLNGGPH